MCDGWRKMKLVDKVVESPKHTSFMFIPEDGGELMEYKPGQYISIRLPPLPGTDHHHVRNYSLSDEPRTDLYRITVKREEEGAVSNHLHNNVTVGDVLDLGVPCGDFILQPGASCAASHPFRSEIESILSYEGTSVHWMYSENKDPDAEYTAGNLDKLVLDKSSKVYICGPPGFIMDSVKMMEEIKVPTDNILYEFFGPPQ